MQLEEVHSNNPGKRFWFKIRVNSTEIGTIETEYSNWYAPPAYVIYKMSIKKRYRRKGYGTKVLLHFLEIAKNNGCSRVMAKIHPLDDNITQDNLVHFYETCGFQFEEINGDLFAIFELNAYTEKY